MGLNEFGGWAGILGRLMRGESLTADEAEAGMAEILEGNATSAQIAAFAFALHMKGETVDEITGLVRGMLAAAEPLKLGGDVLDTCGTGGGAIRRASTFNVSTIASFVIAGAGVKVCKHGNRLASSTSGSADVLEALGVVIDLGPDGVARCLDEAGIGFCFAPRFHPAMRHAGPTRAELGVPTVFNFLGPLTNPARPAFHVMGVSDPALADTMTGVLAASGVRRALVVFGHDGLDEVTITGPSTVLELDGDAVRTYTVDPAALGLRTASIDAVRGGDCQTNAGLARRVLGGEHGPHRDIVLLNAAAGLVAAQVAEELGSALTMAATSIDGGAASGVLDRLVEVSKEAASG